jgi:hypothetical protein
MTDGRFSAVRAQCAPAVLMVRPAHFGFNVQTAQSNRFQRQPQDGASAQSARAESAVLAQALEAAGVHLCTIEDTASPIKPDAVFPNNWVSFHDDGTIVLYPMQAANRRLERRLEVLEAVEQELRFRCRHLLDLSREEEAGRYLEGTGSLVLDHLERVAYACRSARTDESLVREWARAMRYEAEVFDAAGPDGAPIYHTNVMLAIGARGAVICSESVLPRDRARLLARLRASGRELIEIDYAAMHDFGGNLLELRVPAQDGGTQSLLVMSARARAALGRERLARIAATVDRILDVPLPTIETVGGGGARCMLAEVPEVRA